MNDERSDLPPDPWVNQDMLPVAKSMHDMFVAFMAAGFTEPQSIQVVTGVITAMLMAGPAPEAEK